MPYGTIWVKRGLSSDQVRAARALLRWSAEDLATSVSLENRRAELAERHTRTLSKGSAGDSSGTIRER